MRPRAQFDDRPELDRVCGAGLRARGLEPHLEPVVAERAFLRRTGYRVDIDDPERARGDARPASVADVRLRSEEHTSELQSRLHLVCRLLLEKKKKQQPTRH